MEAMTRAVKVEALGIMVHRRDEVLLDRALVLLRRDRARDHAEVVRGMPETGVGRDGVEALMDRCADARIVGVTAAAVSAAREASPAEAS